MGRKNTSGFEHVEEEPSQRGSDGEILLEAVADLVFYVDRGGKILRLGAKDASKLYVPREALVDRSLHDTLPFAVADEALRRIALTLDTGEPQVYEYQLPMPQGVLDFEVRMAATGAHEVLCLVRDVTERKQAERVLRRQNGYLAALHETALDMMSRLELADLLRSIVERAGALMGTPHGYVYLLGPGEAELEMRVGVGAYGEYVGYRLDPGEGLAGKVRESGQPFAVEDYAAWEGHSAKFGRDTFRAVVGVPLKSGSEVVGVIGLSYVGEDRTFTDDELTLLTRFSELASIALDNAGLHASFQQELAERKRAEEALRGSEEQYRTLIEVVQEGIGFVDAEERITYCNRAYAEIFELTPEELTGRSLLEFLDDEQRQKALEQTALRKDRIRSSYELVVKTEDGTRKHLSASGAPIIDEAGVFRGTVHVITDITERRRDEALLLQHSTAIENSIDGMAILDEEGRFVYLNEAHAEIYGYGEREELLGRKWSDLYEEEQLAWIEQHTLPALREHGRWRGETVGRKRDGSTFPQELSISVIEDVGLVCVVRDITERKKAEELRREGEERFRHLVEQAAGPLFVHDLKGRFVDVNQKACEMLGYTREELLSMSVIDVEENFDPVGFMRLWERVASNRSVVIEGSNRHKDGTLFPVEIHLGWYETEGERLVLASVRDITERKRAEETLRQSEERYRAVFERTTDGIFLADFDTVRIIESNAALQDILGYAPEELRGMSLYDVIAEDRATIDRNTRHIQEGKSFLIGERRYRRKDGALVYMETSAASIPHGGREVSCCIARDVTERKEAEEALKKSEARHRRQARELSLLHQVRTALAGELDPTAVFRTVVEAVAETYGYPLVSAYLLEDAAEEGRTLVLQHQVGYRTVLERVPVVEGVMGRVTRTGRPVLLEDVGEDLDFLGAIEGVTSEICAPLSDGEKLVGVLNVETTGGRRLTGDDLRIVRALAEHAGMAVGSARLHARIREAEERFRAFFEHSATGISIATPDRRFIETNPAYQRMTGYTAEELAGRPIAELSHPDDVSEDIKCNELLRTGVLDRYQREKRYVRKDGEILWVRLTVSAVRNEDGAPRFLVGMVEDITERKALEESLAHRASHDPLTGLPNRSLLTERLGQALYRAGRKGWSVALLFLDLDNFKVVNDSMGHESGDRLLVAVAERLKVTVRPEDMVARLGGDEFVVLLEEADLEEAARVADRIAEGLNAPFALGAALPDGRVEGSEITREIFVSASVGIAMSDPDRKEPGQLLRDADLAMYRAKAQGKARHAVFEAKTDEAPPKRLDEENRFRRAVERGEILAYYQPKVSLGDGEVIGMEALARWVDPERGLVLPSEFIPLAEQTGLIVFMGEAVMRQACRMAAEWRRERPGDDPIVVWVNLSPRQFHRVDLVAQVSSVLEETGLDPRCLGLEITEGVAMDHAESTIATLRRLKALGVWLAIDDFGKGYSSLNYVKRFPVDSLKVDSSFVSGICEHPEDLAIVQAVVALGSALGMEVVAEGVESPEQLALLRGLGCDQGQGYHFARPMPAEEASLFLAGLHEAR